MTAALTITYVVIGVATFPRVARYITRESGLDTDDFVDAVTAGLPGLVLAALWPILLVIVGAAALARIVTR